MMLYGFLQKMPYSWWNWEKRLDLGYIYIPYNWCLNLTLAMWLYIYIHKTGGFNPCRTWDINISSIHECAIAAIDHGDYPLTAKTRPDWRGKFCPGPDWLGHGIVNEGLLPSTYILISWAAFKSLCWPFMHRYAGWLRTDFPGQGEITQWLWTIVITPTYWTVQ